MNMVVTIFYLTTVLVITMHLSFSGERFENKAKLNLPNPFQEETETRYRLHHFNILNLGGINDFICVNC